MCQCDYCTLCVCVCVCVRGDMIDGSHCCGCSAQYLTLKMNVWVRVYVCKWQRVPEVPAVYGSLQERGRGSMPGLVSMTTEMWISWTFWVCVNIWIQYLYMRGFWISLVSAQMESPPFMDSLFCTAHKMTSFHTKMESVFVCFNQSVFLLIKSYLKG